MQNSQAALVVAVDGPSGSGKSSVSRGVAKNRGWRYLDTGAMYRSAALAAIRADTNLDDPVAVEELLAQLELQITTDPENPRVFLDGESIDEAIRTAEVTSFVSRVSAIPKVREFMVARQRQEAHEAIASGVGIVVEGRDIGTTVLPSADLKIYLTADQEARAARRALQDNESGREAEVASTAASLAARDKADSSRAASPLVKAADAVVLDATFLTLDEVIAEVIGLIEAREQ